MALGCAVPRWPGLLLIVAVLCLHSAPARGGSSKRPRRTHCNKASAQALPECIRPSEEFTYTPLAAPLLETIAADKNKTSPATSASLNVNLVLYSDYYDENGEARIISGSFGFQGYMGVPGLTGVDPESRAAAYANNVAWEQLPPIPDAPTRAYYSAAPLFGFTLTYGVLPPRPLDTIPVVFSQPVLPSSVSPDAFRVTLNNGSVVTPLVATLLPNLEYNERQTVVIMGTWGNRLGPGTPGALFPVRVEVVDNPANPLTLIGPNGFSPAAGLQSISTNPYVEGNGSRMLRAKLQAYSQLGEGGPAWCDASIANSGSDLYGDLPALFRLRVYNNYGFSPDGIASITPDAFGAYFYLTAVDKRGKKVALTQVGKPYRIRGYGTLTILGLADCGPKQAVYGPTYIEDHDNQYDVMIQGSPAAVARLRSVILPSTVTDTTVPPSPSRRPRRWQKQQQQQQQPGKKAAASGGYHAVYNPGGPGNNPSGNPPGVPFVVPSIYQELAIENRVAAAGAAPSFVTYVEVNGTATRGANGQPVGRLLGPAVVSRRTGYTINAYLDPQGRLFYASFPVQPPA